jgi:phosphoserine phosphatase
VAVFDNDGTLWAEHPFYTQGFFVFDRIRALAPSHPEWKDQEPFKSVINGDSTALERLTEAQLVTLIGAAHSGVTEDEFQVIAKNWLNTAKHPRFGKLFTECVYKPMLELMTELRAHGFKVYIVSGGGVDLIRAFAAAVYGVPNNQVIGSSTGTSFQISNGNSSLLKLPKISFNDGPTKPVNINLQIGIRPLFAFGNSDGDLEMLQYTDNNNPNSLMLLLHHDDGVREYNYDRNTPVGRLDKALDEAANRKWSVVSMKNDFKVIFPF